MSGTEEGKRVVAAGGLAAPSGDRPYLGDMAAVEQLWRDHLGGVALRYGEMNEGKITREEAIAWVEQSERRLAGILSGDDPAWEPMPSWTKGEDGLRAFCAAAIEGEVSPELVAKEGPVMAAVVLLTVEAFGALSRLADGAYTEADARDRFDDLVADGVRLSLGLPSQQEMDDAAPAPGAPPG